MDIPLIDFASGATEAEIAAQMERALADVGFMTVTNIGVEPQAIEQIFAASRDFFTRDPAFKQQFLYRDAEENFGYQGVGMESLDPGKPGDLKETFTLRLNPGHTLSDARWPSPEFQRVCTAFYADCLAAAQRIMRVMATILGQPEPFFVDSVGGENVALRLLHYPSGQVVPETSEQLGAGAHTDYGVVTLLYQGGVSGLEVKDADGNWVPVPCVPGSVVINTGDLIHRWTNGQFRSTEHRVKPISGSEDRYSVAFFVDPDDDTLVEVLPQCVDAANPCRYPPITAGEHIQQKLEHSHNA